MSRIDLHESSKLTLAEGAAADTPGAGLVRLYAKADGLLYSKDDAGVETALGGGGAADLGDLGDVTVSGSETDGQVLTSDGAGAFAFEDAPGAVADILDIPTAEDDDSLVLAPDGAGGVEFRAEAGGGGIESGTSFPGSPTTGDLFHRSDLSPALWRFDGTRWRSEQVLSLSFPQTEKFAAYTATANIGRLPIPFIGVFGIWGLRFDWWLIPESGHDSSNYYTCKINWANQADSDTQWGAVTLDSKTATSSANFAFTGAIGAALSTDARELKLRIDKVSSAANITYATGVVHFQLTAT